MCMFTFTRFTIRMNVLKLNPFETKKVENKGFGVEYFYPLSNNVLLSKDRTGLILNP